MRAEATARREARAEASEWEAAAGTEAGTKAAAAEAEDAYVREEAREDPLICFRYQLLG